MPCAACEREIKTVAKGLCRACYQRLQKRGTTDYAEQRSRSTCSVSDCGKPSVSGGLCDTHRKRLARHGHIEQTRPDDWGSKEKHPLNHTWSWMMRHRSTHPIDPSWADFLQFVSDVGKRPSPSHKLFSANEDEPIGPNNFLWKKSIVEKAEGEDRKTSEARRQRVYRKLRPEAYQEMHLKKSYGLSVDTYNRMMADQNGLCAICRKPENLMIRGSVVSLAVDHCHTGGHVRALLCSACNTALGLFRDDPSVLRAAVAYLEKHTLPLPPE